MMILGIGLEIRWASALLAVCAKSPFDDIATQKSLVSR
jgi:hypothetical protein